MPMIAASRRAGAPVRCTGCKAYINASVKWRDSGREWICNLCGLPNVVNRYAFKSFASSHQIGISPSFREYYAMVDHSGRRVDASTRPELSLGSYEFVAPESYANAASSFVALACAFVPVFYCHPRYPSVLFLIDNSHQAVASGFSDAVIQSVRQCIADIQYLKTRVGIAMYVAWHPHHALVPEPFHTLTFFALPFPCCRSPPCWLIDVQL